MAYRIMPDSTSAVKILSDIESLFSNVKGPDYGWVYFDKGDAKPWSSVELDGQFTARQLHLILDAMDAAEKEAARC